MRSFTSFRMTLRVRFFTEFTLSQKARPFPFASLRVRVTHGEGFKMTNMAFLHCDTAPGGLWPGRASGSERRGMGWGKLFEHYPTRELLDIDLFHIWHLFQEASLEHFLGYIFPFLWEDMTQTILFGIRRNH